MEAEKKRKHSITTMEDLCDELLIEIFTRLNSYKTVVATKLVWKYWSSLISDPKFGIKFLNHKKLLQNQLPLHQEQEQLPWTFLSTMRLRINNKDCDNVPSHEVFRSPNFTLEFLPFRVMVAATFKDLVLCLDVSNNNSGHQNQNQKRFVLCNPLTKHWVTLPSTKLKHTCYDPKFSWVCLICGDPEYNDKQGRIDYRFRVVVLDDPVPMQSCWNHEPYNKPYKVFNLLVFFSEDWQWRNIDVRVPLASEFVFLCYAGAAVCKGMVCLRQYGYFGMFNPFDVTPTLSDTLEAKVLPFVGHPYRDSIFECGGRLILPSCFSFEAGDANEARLIEVPMETMELDIISKSVEYYNEDVLPIGLQRLEKGSFNISFGGMVVAKRAPPVSIRMIGVHPSNRNLFYFLVKEEVFLCDVASSRFKCLGTLLPDNLEWCFFGTIPRLELQHWPTPLPTIST